MNLLPRSAAQRIALAAFAAYSAAMLLLGVAVFLATHAAFVRQLDSSIEQATRAFESEYRDDGIRGLREAIAERQGPGQIALGTVLFAPGGERIAGNIDTPMPMPGWHRIFFIDPAEGADPARAKVTVLPGGYRLVVAADLESLEAIDRTILGMFAVAFAALLALGLGGALLLAHYLRRRLATIETTANAIVSGNFDQRADVGSTDDEFDRVAASLNAMLDRIADLIANLRQVSADLAHDLRTPLAGLRNQLEALQNESDPGTRAAMVGGAVDKADEILALFAAILRISEVEEGSLCKGFAPLDLSVLVADLGETLTPLAEDSGHILQLAVPTGISIEGDRELLAQAIINLVENAMKYTAPGVSISLALSRAGNAVRIEVRDNGPGIPAAEIERVKRRFVRLETSRSSPGHGLGLSLVAAVAKAHGGQLVLEDAAPGLIAGIVIPAGKVR